MILRLIFSVEKMALACIGKQLLKSKLIYHKNERKRVNAIQTNQVLTNVPKKTNWLEGAQLEKVLILFYGL